MIRLRLILLAAVAVWMTAHPAPLQAQNVVKVVSGNGQMVICGSPLFITFPPVCPPFSTMTVQVMNAGGVPQGGVGVNWAITSGPGVLSFLNSATTTDANGMTSNPVVFTTGYGPPANQFQRVFQNTITASIGDTSAVFYLSEAEYENTSGIPIAPVGYTALDFLSGLYAGNTLSGQAGTTGGTPIQLRLFATGSGGVSNVSLQLVSLQDPSTGPVVSCKENAGGTGVALTDASGLVTCTPVFSGAPGNGQFYLLIGGGGIVPADPTQPPFQILSSPFLKLSVTPAAVGSLQIVSGNSQTGAPGQALSLFQVEVDGVSGLPLAGQQVSWTSTPVGAIGFSGSVTTTDANGRTSILGTLSGTSSGSIQVTATSVSDPSKSVKFSVTSIPPVTVTGFTIASGNNQSAQVSAAFSQPLAVQVTVSAGSAANQTVQFRVLSGSVTVSSSTAVTDASGRAQVNVTAGSVTGAASVQASIATSTGVGAQTFQLTVTPAAPPISSSSFVNGADQQSNSLSPCSIGMLVAPIGTLGISNVSPTFPGQPVNANASITFSGVGAPILGVATLPNGVQQGISFQVPCETAPSSSVPVAVTIAGATTNTTAAVQAASPGIFMQVGSDATLRAVVVRPDGSFATLTNPARKGENVSIFVTGLGVTSPAVGTYSLPAIGGAMANATGTIVVGISGGGAPVISSRLSEDLPGVFVVTFTVPSDSATGNNVVISVATIPQGAASPIYSAGARIPVQ